MFQLRYNQADAYYYLHFKLFVYLPANTYFSYYERLLNALEFIVQ